MKIRFEVEGATERIYLVYDEKVSIIFSGYDELNEFIDTLKNNTLPELNGILNKKCSWCGGDENTNDKGKLITKIIHSSCYEGLMNGDGII